MIALLALAAFAQEPTCTVLAPADAANPGRILTGAEAIPGGALVIDAGKIAAVGAPAAIGVSGATWNGRTCTRIDISGHTVSPGFVAVGSAIGVSEIDLESSTRDDTGDGDPIRSALRVVDSYNPHSVVIPVTRHGGVTSTVVFPGGGLFSGQAAWADLGGSTQAEAVLDPSVAMVARLDGESRAEALLRLREVFDDALFYDRRKSAFDENRSRPLAASRLDLEALRPVLVGEQPLVVAADRAADIEALLRLAQERKLKLIIAGGAEAWVLADDLAAAKVPVIVDPLVYGPGSFDQIHARPDNAALLAEAGVPVMISSYETRNARVLGQLAGNAVRGGMEWDDAMKALTVTPAEVFGLADHGVLAPGKVANVVVWGSVDHAALPDPFETSSTVKGIWVGGVPMSLETRQTELRDRYLALPGTPLPPLAP